MRRVKSITAKYIFLGLITLGLIASFIFLSFWFTNRIKDDARRINLAGKQRMLSYEMSWLLIPPPPLKELGEERAEPLNYLEEELTVFEEVLYALRDGSKKYKLAPLTQGDYIVMPHREEALDELDSLIEKWHSVMKPTLTKAVEGVPEAFRDYNIIIHSYVDEIDSFVSHLEKNYKKEFMLYGRIRLAVMTLSVFVFIALVFFTKKTLVMPILKLRYAAKEFEKGNLDMKVEIKSRDEIGELGNAFNSMARTRKQAEAEIERNYHIQRVLNSVLQISLEPVLLDEQLGRTLDEIFSVPWLSVESKGCIFLIEEDPDVLVMKAHRRLAEPLLSACAKVPFGRCLCGRAASMREVVFADCIDDRHDTRFQEMAPHGHLCIPIQSGSRLLGVINLYVGEGHRRDPGEEEFFTAVANTLAGTIERNQAEEALRKAHSELEQSEERFHSVADTAKDAIVSIDSNGEIVFWNTAAENIFGYSDDEAVGKLVTLIMPKEFHEAHRKGFDRVIKTGESKIIGKTVEVSGLRKDGSAFPIELSLSIWKVKAGVFFTAIIRDITKRKNLEKKLLTMSLSDELTGLSNRRGFFTLAEHILKIAKRQKQGIFMLYTDVDNFKDINDTLGHKEGDNALIDIANILRTSYRESDVIARIGGDEFVVILVGTAGDCVEMIISRLQEKLDDHNKKSNRSYKLSVSVGIAYYDPENPCSVDELLALGDKLMYKQKKHKQKS